MIDYNPPSPLDRTLASLSDESITHERLDAQVLRVYVADVETDVLAPEFAGCAWADIAYDIEVIHPSGAGTVITRVKPAGRAPVSDGFGVLPAVPGQWGFLIADNGLQSLILTHGVHATACQTNGGA